MMRKPNRSNSPAYKAAYRAQRSGIIRTQQLLPIPTRITREDRNGHLHTHYAIRWVAPRNL